MDCRSTVPAFPAILNRLPWRHRCDRACFEDYANLAPCPASTHHGLCDVYQWRPMTAASSARPSASKPMPPPPSPLRTMFAGASTEQIRGLRNAVPHELEQKLLEELPARAKPLLPLPCCANIPRYAIGRTYDSSLLPVTHKAPLRPQKSNLRRFRMHSARRPIIVSSPSAGIGTSSSSDSTQYPPGQKTAVRSSWGSKFLDRDASSISPAACFFVH